MSYSILSTKRKFHRLLDSLANGGAPNSSTAATNSASTFTPAADTTDASDSLPQLPPDHASSSSARPSKRPRTIPKLKQRSELVSASPQLSLLLNRQASAVRQSSTRAPGMSVKATAGETARVPPTSWNPADKAAFRARLASFRDVVNWRSKPEEINEVVFARAGWRCVGDETVECVSCWRRVVVVVDSEKDVNRDEARDAEEEEEAGEAIEALDDIDSEAFIERTRLRIVDEHAESCMWRVKQCHPSIQTVTMYPASRSVDDLRSRFTANAKYSGILPSDLELPDDLSLDDEDITLLSNFLSNTASTNSSQSTEPPNHETNVTHRTALLTALFGWTVDAQPSTRPASEALLACSECFARTGLWMFAPQDGRPALYSSFDAAGAHKSYCPWASGAVQNAGLDEDGAGEDVRERKAAWAVLRDIVVHYAASNGARDEAGSRPSSSGSLRVMTDEERRARHRKGLAWLQRLKFPNRGTKKD